MRKTDSRIYNSVEYWYFRRCIMMYSVSLIIVALIYAILLSMAYSYLLLAIAIVNCLVFLCLDAYNIYKLIVLLTCYNDLEYVEVRTVDMVIVHPNSTYTAVWVFIGDDRYTSDKVIKLVNFARLVKNDRIRVGLIERYRKCIVFMDEQS